MSDAVPKSIVVCGLPASGKTTFLAALWHVIQSGDFQPKMSMSSLAFGDYGYVNSIRDRWLSGTRQDRTVGTAFTIGIDLKAPDGEEIRLLFPDHSGETFDSIWEHRSCEESVSDQLRDRTGVLLFIGPKDLTQPMPLIEVIITEAQMRAALPDDENAIISDDRIEEWDAKSSPDQVKLVDMLQILQRNLKGRKGEKLAICISAWDHVDQTIKPETFVQNELPLLHQYLLYADHGFEYKIYGVSAQGTEYLEDNDEDPIPPKLGKLLNNKHATSRIQLIDDGTITNDLTIPLSWLTS